MGKFIITTASPERVTLADVYFHFKELNPTGMQATIELVQKIREGRFELRAGRITKVGVKNRIIWPPKRSAAGRNDKPIPKAALADKRMNFKPWELSRAVWKRSPPDSSLIYELITASRDQVLALKPAHTDNPAPIEGEKHPGGRPRIYSHEEILIEGAVSLFANGLPPGDLDGKDGLCERVALKLDKPPSDTQLKAILRPLLNRAKASLRDK